MFEFLKVRKKRKDLTHGLKLNSPLANGLSVYLPEAGPEILETAKLLHASYVRRQILPSLPGVSSSSGQARLLIETVLPTTALVIVRAGGLISGTAQLYQRTIAPLPIESSFDLRSILTKKTVEIGSLALHNLKSARLEEVYFPLIAYLYRLLKRLSIDRVVIAVQPNTVLLYKALFGFREFKGGEQRAHAFAAGTQAVGLFVDMAEFELFLNKNFASEPIESNLKQYLTQNAQLESAMILPEAQTSLIHPKAAVVLEELYVNREPLIANASLEWRKKVASHYPDTDEYRWLFKLDDNVKRRQARRHTVDYNVTLTDGFGLVRQAKAIDLSLGGMKVILTTKGAPPSLDEDMQVEITPLLEAKISLRGKVRRYDLKEYSLGLQIVDPPQEYLDFVESVKGTAFTQMGTGKSLTGMTPAGSYPSVSGSTSTPTPSLNITPPPIPKKR